MKYFPIRVSRWSAHHPWRAIIGWLAFVTMCCGAGITVGTNAADTEDFWVGEAGRAEQMATEGGLEREPTEHVIIYSESGQMRASLARAAAEELTERMEALPEVDSVAAPVLSARGTVLRVSVTMEGPELEAKHHVASLLAQTAAVQDAYPELVVEESGSPAISQGVNDQRSEDLALSERITLPVTLITLLLVFGSVVMASVPIVLALSSIASALGLSMLASHLFPDSGVGTNLILLIGLAVGVDYTLFYLKREREERARADGALSTPAIVDLASATAGRAIVVSALAVIVSTATLYLATDVIFTSLATGTILVVSAAMLSSVTVLPALMVKIGERAERRNLRRKARRERQRKPDLTRPPRPEMGRAFSGLLRPAITRPVATLCLSVLGLLALAAPALGMKLVDPTKDTFSRDIPAMQVYDRVTAAFPELLVQHEVVVQAAPERAYTVRQALIDLHRRTQSDALFAASGQARVQTSDDGRTSALTLAVPHASLSDDAVASLEHLRGEHLPGTVGQLPGVEAAVSGDVARSVDYVGHQQSKMPLVVAALLLATFVVTVLIFRSVVIGLVGVGLNLLSAGAALGALTLVFQPTWAEGLLGFESLGGIASRVPLFLLVVLFGLSMDYQVFVISRIQEAREQGRSARAAVVEGIERSAKVVTSAAVVMVTVFAAFVALHLTEMKQMGFCLALAVLLDTLVIRLMVLPSILLLLGERAWPSRRRPDLLAGPADRPERTLVP